MVWSASLAIRKSSPRLFEVLPAFPPTGAPKDSPTRARGSGNAPTHAANGSSHQQALCRQGMRLPADGEEAGQHRQTRAHRPAAIDPSKPRLIPPPRAAPPALLPHRLQLHANRLFVFIKRARRRRSIPALFTNATAHQLSANDSRHLSQMWARHAAARPSIQRRSLTANIWPPHWRAPALAPFWTIPIPDHHPLSPPPPRQTARAARR